ncbi:hypothetical protein E0H68_06225 [Rhizobium leguminosarum bv. viciae]|uniref:hypothetical protein n=1 Tax=Rhizobium leguminosarum TaxID=384 RepID=UPI00103F404C|nr:hypothetical protein [Rhizobium leguminosarum]TCA17368.1 hypothetical protein E0H68_06225 [Rhizobium leguminosarum bv. viciae]
MPTPYSQDLANFDAKLRDHYRGLKSERGADPIFIIEHGLEAQAVSELQNLVGRKLRLLGPGSAAWIGSHLSLVIAITEVGYRYQGTGTDFWPKVDDTLGVSLALSDRAEISALFARLSQQYGFATPNRSDWALAYNHIAWPIRNALAPLEIHKPLLIALGKILSSGIPLRDDHLLISKLVSIADGLWSRRLRDWLEDPRLSIELSRALLAPEEGAGWFEPRIVARIGNDLRRDPDAAIAFQRARRLVSRERRLLKPHIEASRYNIIVVNGRPMGLSLTGPSLSDADLQQVATGSFATCEIAVESVSQAHPIKSFLAGGVIDIGQPSKPIAKSPLSLRQYGEALDTAPDFLDQLQPKQPSLFLWSGSDGSFPEANANGFVPSESKVMFISWDETDRSLGFEPLECWEGCSAFLLDPLNTNSQRVLRDFGLSYESSALISFSGGTLSRSSNTVSYVEGLPVFCRVNANSLKATIKGIEDDLISHAHFKKDEVFRLDLSPGTFRLDLETDAASHNIEISVRSQSRGDSVRIYLDPPSAMIDNLASDALSIVLRSEVTLHDVKGRAWITRGGQTVNAPIPFETDVPGRLDASSSLIQGLKRVAIEDANMASIDIKLQFEGLGDYSWRLERDVRRLTYQPDKRAWQDEIGNSIGGLRVADISAPLLLVEELSGRTDGETTSLWMPNTSPWDAISSAIIEAPSVIRMGNHDATDPVASSRSVRGLDGRPGFTTLLSSYLAWRTAEPTNLLASHHAGLVYEEIEKALVESFCGGEWRKIEHSGGGLQRNAYSELSGICIARQMAAGNRFPQLNKAETANLHAELKRSFSNIAPDLSILLSDGAEFEELDYAINDAYEKLSRDRESAGALAIDELDIFNSDKTWQKAIRDAVAAAKRPAFQPLILPSSRWKTLSSLRYKNCSLDDVVEELVASHVDALRSPANQWIGSREIRIGLQLWMSPRDILKTSGSEEALIKLLSDRQTSRAIRYAALRIRAEKSRS